MIYLSILILVILILFTKKFIKSTFSNLNKLRKVQGSLTMPTVNSTNTDYGEEPPSTQCPYKTYIDLITNLNKTFDLMD